MSTADDNRRIMSRLRDLEREIGAPGFWDTERAPRVVQAHALVLQEAIRRGLTTFSRN